MHFTLPLAMYESSNFSTFLSTLFIVSLFNYGYPNGCEDISYSSFDLHFPNG